MSVSSPSRRTPHRRPCLGADSVEVLGVDSLDLGVELLVLGVDSLVLGVDSLVLGADCYHEEARLGADGVKVGEAEAVHRLVRHVVRQLHQLAQRAALDVRRP
eukprot:832012-Prorocentrum_minimum.AAC.1